MRFPVKIGSVLLALVAMLLLGVISAGVASAAEFQAEPSFPVKFTAKGGAGLLETKGKKSVTCTETEGSGEVSGATSVAGVTVHFKGCAAEHLVPQALPCTTPGQASGEIVTNAIKGTPVDLDPLHAQAGLLLEPASGTTFASFVCKAVVGGLPVEETLTVTGSLIGQVKTTQLNEFRETLSLEFVQASGIQAWTQVEAGGAQHFLLTEGKGSLNFAAEQSAVGEAAPGTTTTTASEGKKVKLVP
jgi:hypothetical protein